MLKHVDENNFEEEVLNSKKAVLVDFFATWCGPCQMLGPVLERIGNSRADFDIAKVDVDQAQELAFKYGIVILALPSKETPFIVLAFCNLVAVPAFPLTVVCAG